MGRAARGLGAAAAMPAVPRPWPAAGFRPLPPMRGRAANPGGTLPALRAAHESIRPQRGTRRIAVAVAMPRSGSPAVLRLISMARTSTASFTRSSTKVRWRTPVCWVCCWAVRSFALDCTGTSTCSCRCRCTPARLVERGFNQSFEIARFTARIVGQPCAPRALVRGRATAPQVELSRQERERNVSGAFTAATADSAAVRGRARGSRR